MLLKTTIKKKNKIIMIGDSVNTDINGANKIGIKSALVLDGFKKNEFKKFNKKRIGQALKILDSKPDYIIKNISI